MATAKSTTKSKKEKAQMEYLVDLEIPFPEDFAHLVKGGHLVIYFGPETADIIRDVSAELIRSRNLPVDTSNVNIDDPMVLWLANRRKDELGEDGTEAILAARHVYDEQIREANQQAMILALTAHTEIVQQYDKDGKLNPPPEVDGGLFKEKEGPRKKSTFMKMVENRAEDIPKPKINLANPYEARMAWLDATIEAAGFAFYNKAVTSINRGIMKIVTNLEETDEDGFRS
jgi:hypothetical protein